MIDSLTAGEERHSWVQRICCSHIHPPHVIFLAWQKTCNCRTDGRLYKPSLQQLMRLESRSYEPCLTFFAALLSVKWVLIISSFLIPSFRPRCCLWKHPFSLFSVPTYPTIFPFPFPKLLMGSEKWHRLRESNINALLKCSLRDFIMCSSNNISAMNTKGIAGR